MPPPLIGTYAPPAVRKGDVVTCLYRDAECVVTGIHDGPIPWPRVRGRDTPQGGSGLWVNEELVQAIRTDSAAALKYWFGVGTKAAWNWRKHFCDGTKFSTPGSKAANQKAGEAGAAAVAAKEWTDEERARKAELSTSLGLRPGPRWTDDGWTAEQRALLGTDHDGAIAERIGRTTQAVTVARVRLKIPAFSGWVTSGREWTAEDLARLGTDHDEAVAVSLGRTLSAVRQRRRAAGIPVFRDRRGRALP